MSIMKVISIWINNKSRFIENNTSAMGLLALLDREGALLLPRRNWSEYDWSFPLSHQANRDDATSTICWEYRVILISTIRDLTCLRIDIINDYSNVLLNSLFSCIITTSSILVNCSCNCDFEINMYEIKEIT